MTTLTARTPTGRTLHDLSGLEIYHIVTHHCGLPAGDNDSDTQRRLVGLCREIIDTEYTYEGMRARLVMNLDHSLLRELNRYIAESGI